LTYLDLILKQDPALPAVLPVTEDSQGPRPEVSLILFMVMCQRTQHLSCQICQKSAYSLSKLLGETAAEQYVRWVPDMKILSYRFSNVIDVDRMSSDAHRFETTSSHVHILLIEYENWNTDQFQNNHFGRRWNAFGYIVGSDCEQSSPLLLAERQFVYRMHETQPRRFERAWKPD